MRQGAVVRQQQQALAVGVEPAHVVDPLLDTAEEVGERGAPLLVGHRGHHAARLVHRQVDQPGVGDHPLAVDVDLRRRGVDLVAELGDLAVHGDPAAEDQVFAGPARADAGCGEDLLQPFERRRIIGPNLFDVVGQERRQGRELVDRVETELLQEQRGGAVEEGAGFRLGAALLDEAAA